MIVPSADVLPFGNGQPIGYPLLEAYLAADRSQMHALVDIRKGLPDELFHDWLEGGLRMMEGCKPSGRIHRAMEE